MKTFTEQSRRIAQDILYAKPEDKIEEYSFRTDHDLSRFNDRASSLYNHPIFNANIDVEESQPTSTTSAVINQGPHQTSFADNITFEPAKPQFESYYAPDAALPKEVLRTSNLPTFRPDLHELDEDGFLTKVDTNTTPIASPVNIGIFDLEIEKTKKAAAVKNIDLDQDTHTVARLNAKGMIAIVSFFAIVALVTVLIIINAVSIGSGNARIELLEQDMAIAQSQITAAEQQRANALRQATANLYLPNGQVNTQYLQDKGLVQLPTEQIPPQQVNPVPPNYDASSNWFNNMSRWFSGLFGN